MTNKIKVGDIVYPLAAATAFQVLRTYSGGSAHIRKAGSTSGRYSTVSLNEYTTTPNRANAERDRRVETEERLISLKDLLRTANDTISLQEEVLLEASDREQGLKAALRTVEAENKETQAIVDALTKEAEKRKGSVASAQKAMQALQIRLGGSRWPSNAHLKQGVNEGHWKVVTALWECDTFLHKAIAAEKTDAEAIRKQYHGLLRETMELLKPGEYIPTTFGIMRTTLLAALKEVTTPVRHVPSPEDLPAVHVPDDPDAPHYYGRVEAIDAMEVVSENYTKGNGFHAAQVLKYVWRAPKKGNMLKDLKKAQTYLERLIARAEGRVGVWK
jgi:hypothetical protein